MAEFLPEQSNRATHGSKKENHEDYTIHSIQEACRC